VAAGRDLPHHSRWPAIAAAIVVLVIAAIGGGAYVAHDQLSHMLAASTAAPKGERTAVAGPPPKTTERIGGEAPAGAATGPAPQANPEQGTSTAPATATQPGTTVARATPPAAGANPGTETAVPATQRAILYEETPDRQSGSAYAGHATWTISQVPTGEGHNQQTQLQAEVEVPDRHVQLKLTIKRNLDPTLPASHTIDLQFKLPNDFTNGSIANVPGILFKPTEQAAGTALAGLSVRVMNNFFLIGLSSTPTEQAHNLDVMRQNGWIDLPILYENGRRAVLTIQKGDAGMKVFDQAITAWQREAATAAATRQPPVGATPGTPDPGTGGSSTPAH
jgi:hypothetical protein